MGSTAERTESKPPQLSSKPYLTHESA